MEDRELPLLALASYTLKGQTRGCEPQEACDEHQ